MLPTVGTSLNRVAVARGRSSLLERLARREVGFVTEGIVLWKSMSPATRSTRRRRVPAAGEDEVSSARAAIDGERELDAPARRKKTVGAFERETVMGAVAMSWPTARKGRFGPRAAPVVSRTAYRAESGGARAAVEDEGGRRAHLAYRSCAQRGRKRALREEEQEVPQFLARLDERDQALDAPLKTCTCCDALVPRMLMKPE